MLLLILKIPVTFPPPQNSRIDSKHTKKLKAATLCYSVLKNKQTNKKTKQKQWGGGGHQRKKISILQIVFLLINITLVTST